MNAVWVCWGTPAGHRYPWTRQTRGPAPYRWMQLVGAIREPSGCDVLKPTRLSATAFDKLSLRVFVG